MQCPCPEAQKVVLYRVVISYRSVATVGSQSSLELHSASFENPAEVTARGTLAAIRAGETFRAPGGLAGRASHPVSPV
jgi:hypothetical protein